LIVLKSQIDLQKLHADVKQLDYHMDGSGALMAFGPSMGIPSIIGPYIQDAIKEISEYRNLTALHLMINKLPTRCYVPFHIDTLIPTSKQGKDPHLERWHLPVITNLECFWQNLDEEPIHFQAGMWYGPVRYWVPHSVWNAGNIKRIHLVVDLDSERVE